MRTTRADFAACLATFEALVALGISKEAAASGNYNQGAILRAGLSAWRSADAAMRPWRSRSPELVSLVAIASRNVVQLRPAEDTPESAPVGVPERVQPAVLANGQMLLF